MQKSDKYTDIVNEDSAFKVDPKSLVDVKRGLVPSQFNLAEYAKYTPGESGTGTVISQRGLTKADRGVDCNCISAFGICIYILTVLALSYILYGNI